ncbi:hypothetical protein [Hyphomonas johnsonii]|uniref:Uncharacterized protein n=1 Tax=Hyphomonas johnsonii MHS-2 TaxID=1280950 RepID=A0A059FT30_9PROT|nr:hypothetical protein [Hyphomonas johnsonii]KCZ93829.1 hypothetical protein HJO_00595 [Hyphomonas johnsonii MHS-2]
MEFCRECLIAAYCKRLVTPIFVDDELKRPFFQSDLKAFLVRYTYTHGLPPSEWHEHLVDLNRDYRGWYKSGDGREVLLRLSVFEIPHIREWFRDYIQIVPNGVETRLRGESKERVRVLATIMRAYYPEEAMMWGVRAANDN